MRTINLVPRSNTFKRSAERVHCARAYDVLDRAKALEASTPLERAQALRRVRGLLRHAPRVVSTDTISLLKGLWGRGWGRLVDAGLASRFSRERLALEVARLELKHRSLWGSYAAIDAALSPPPRRANGNGHGRSYGR